MLRSLINFRVGSTQLVIAPQKLRRKISYAVWGARATQPNKFSRATQLVISQKLRRKFSYAKAARATQPKKKETLRMLGWTCDPTTLD